MHIGNQVCQASGQEYHDTSEYHGKVPLLTRAAQALVTGKYHKARQYSVEAVCLYGIAIYQQREDPDMASHPLRALLFWVSLVFELQDMIREEALPSHASVHKAVL